MNPPNLSASLLALLSGDGKRSVVVLEAFLDESGTHAGAPILNVSAFVGTHDQWTEFLKSWRYTSFHSSKPSADPLKPILMDAIETCKLTGFVCLVEPKEYSKQSSQWKSSLGNAYAACALACAMMIFRETVGPISFVIEDGQPNSDWVERMLRAMMLDAQWRERIASVALVKKTDFIQLHTADFLAHSWSTVDRIWCKRLYETGRVYELPLSSEQLHKMSADHKKMVAVRRAEMQRLKRQEKKTKLSKPI